MASQILVVNKTTIKDVRGYAKVARHIILKALKSIKGVQGKDVAVIFAKEQEMRKLNRTYRNKDKVSNVLTFDEGDIVICLAEAKREAKKYGWTLNYEIARLALHGFLHLQGYDHEKVGETRKMERIEKHILELEFPKPNY